MTREYPQAPIVGVGGVIFFRDGRVVLAKRGKPPAYGRWSIPGGAVHLGERLEDGLKRELLEETGIRVEVGPVVKVFDRIIKDDEGRIQYHYVLVDYLCFYSSGTLRPGSDILETALIYPSQMDRFNLLDETRALIDDAYQLFQATIR
nr:NUDIX domain-containing protein [Desulfobacterales bacterium]